MGAWVGGAPWASVALTAALAMVLWGASLLLPSIPPIARAATWENWTNFGERILRDVLQAVAFLALAMALSALFPRLGLLIERIVWGSPRWAPTSLAVMCGDKCHDVGIATPADAF